MTDTYEYEIIRVTESGQAEGGCRVDFIDPNDNLRNEWFFCNTEKEVENFFKQVNAGNPNFVIDKR